MSAELIPMRWPGQWTDPAAIDLLKGTPVNLLLVEKEERLAPVINRARQLGLSVASPASPPANVAIIEGHWPGVRLSATNRDDTADAGPTGDPWIDSNGWKVRLTAARRPGSTVWVDAPPQEPRLFAEAYQTAVADAAVYGGRWIISLDAKLAAALAAREPAALETWRRIGAAANFFAARRAWSELVPAAVLGVISDFAGPNEALSGEILNLVARTNQQYRILLKGRVSPSSFDGLRAVLYADEGPPAPGLREQVMTFVRAGGLLITGPSWGRVAGALPAADEHPRYRVQHLGRGRVAVARASFDDPYLVANDAGVLVSHRHDLLRFWNGGAVGSYFTTTPEKRGAVVHLLFYTGIVFSPPTVRIAGRYRGARLWTLDAPAPQSVKMETGPEAVELYLPPALYAAVELEGELSKS